MLRYGLVGCGMMGREHVANVRAVGGAEIVALADPHPHSLAATQAMLGGAVATFPDAAALAAGADLDAVIVASPNHTHRAVLEPLFAAGHHILCEKPLATTVADARWIEDAAARSGRVFWTAMEYRYMPPAAAFIAQVHAGRVGALRMLAIREHRFPFLVKVGDWNRFSANTGGTMVEKCCHFFDLMRLIVGAEAIRVFCSGAMDVNHRDERYDGRAPDIIDNSYTTVEFANGVRALLDLAMFADGAEDQEEMTAVGDAARLDCRIPSGTLVRYPRVSFGQAKQPERAHVAVDPVALAAGQHHGATFYQHQKFLRACRGEGPVEVTAEDGRRAVAIGAAAERSAREHRVVEMHEIDG